jgi:hypothetical protein
MASCPNCGYVLDGHYRSTPDHNRFFALIESAYEHWPEAHRFQPKSAEHLRGWLLCEANHCTREILQFEYEADDQTRAKILAFGEVLFEACMRQAPRPRYLEWTFAGLEVRTPKSISHQKCGQKRFNEVRNAVEDVIVAETGVAIDDLLPSMEITNGSRQAQQARNQGKAA